MLARAVMPRHHVPSAFFFLDEMPRAANGKPDLAQLRRLELPSRASAPAAPVGDTEARLAQIWQEAFEQSDIGRSDDFFDLGGESLIAAVIAARVHVAFGVELRFGNFVDHPALGQMAAFIERARAAVPHGDADEVPLVAIDRSRPLPLSLLQRIMWKPRNAPHNASSLTRAAAERIEGRLDVDLFRESVAEVIARHEVLRTRFPEIDGEPVQVIEPPRPFELPLVDWSLLEDAEERAAAFLESEGSRVFDVTIAPPIALTGVCTFARVSGSVCSILWKAAQLNSRDSQNSFVVG